MPVDRSAIDAQLREIGEGERWWECREFRDLPHILHPDEQMRGLVLGKLLASRLPRMRPVGRWLLVATTHRLICLRQERYARKEVDVPAGQITRLKQSTRFRSHQITLTTPKRTYKIRVARDEAFRFVGALAPLVAPQPAPPLSSEIEQ